MPCMIRLGLASLGSLGGNYLKNLYGMDSSVGLWRPGGDPWSRRSDLNRQPTDYDLLRALGAYFEHSQRGEGDFKDRYQVSENSMGPLEVTSERRGTLARLLICDFSIG